MKMTNTVDFSEKHETYLISLQSYGLPLISNPNNNACAGPHESWVLQYNIPLDPPIYIPSGMCDSQSQSS